MTRSTTLAATMVLVLAALSGCAGLRGRHNGPEMVGRVDHLDLWAGAMAADVDGRPGADGVSLRLTMFKRVGRKTEAVAGAGAVEVLLYDGDVDYKTLEQTAPFQRWLFTPDQMRPFRSRFWGLWCYEMTLQWPEKAPTKSTVTILARYRAPDGTLLYSAPATIPIRQ